MVSLLRERPAGTAEMLDAFGDPALLRAALRFEAALARAEASEGLIPREHAVAVEAACAGFDIENLAEEAAHAGTLAIPLVAALRARLSPEAARSLHKGATSQDLADTALMLQAASGCALCGATSPA